MLIIVLHSGVLFFLIVFFCPFFFFNKKKKIDSICGFVPSHQRQVVIVQGGWLEALLFCFSYGHTCKVSLKKKIE